MKKHTIIIMLIAVCLVFSACAAHTDTSSVPFDSQSSGSADPSVNTRDNTEGTHQLPVIDPTAGSPEDSSESETNESGTSADTPSSESSDATSENTTPDDTTTQADSKEGTTEEPATTGGFGGPSDGKKYVALTFDDGPDMRYTSSTERILDLLEQYNAKATFFVLACQLDFNGVADEATGETFAQRNAKLVKRAYDMGMEIGSHTYNHKNLNTLSSSEISEELTSSCRRIEEVTGARVTIMRPPYGNANQTVRDTIDMPMIIWDVDSEDWSSKDADKIYSTVMNTVRPGSIILMHDIYNTTADGVAKVLPALQEQGYTIVSVSELYEIYGKELKPHPVHMSARQD